MGTMASSTHQFEVLDLIRAGLQDLGAARTLLDELRADGIDDDRLCLLMKTLEQTCEPDIALRNLVDIIKALQSQGRDFHQVITDDAGLVRLVTVLGVSDGMGKLMRFRPELVMAAASDSCESHLYNHAQRRAHVLEAVGADPADNRMPKATKPLAEAATALRQTYRKQLAAIMAQDATADDPIEIQPRISQELSDLADAALEGALAIARNEVDGSEHVLFAIIIYPTLHVLLFCLSKLKHLQLGNLLGNMYLAIHHQKNVFQKYCYAQIENGVLVVVESKLYH